MLDAVGRIRRPLRAAGVEALVASALVACVIYVQFDARRDRALRRELATAAGDRTTAQTLAVTLRRNVELSALEGNDLPPRIAAALHAAITRAGPPSVPGAVVMIYTNMACQRSLRAGLQTLGEHRDALVRAGIAPIVLVAQHDDADRERALLLREEGLLTFPIAFTAGDSLAAAFFPSADDTFDEEPIYLRLDDRLRVRSAFHADQRRPELLDLWLEGFSDATSLRFTSGAAGGDGARAARGGVRSAGRARARDGPGGPARVESALR